MKKPKLIACCIEGCPDEGAEILQAKLQHDVLKLICFKDIPICKIHASMCKKLGVQAVMSEPLTQAAQQIMNEGISELKQKAANILDVSQKGSGTFL